jgi:methionine synthase / methylenetetrahydrofolate reductase(NADPH)
MNLLEELEERIVCGDGAMGTLLLDRGVPVDHCLEELCVSEPNRIRVIHDEYIAAGARVIETNTFGANAVRLQRFGFEDRVAEINKAAAQVALKAARGKDVCVAGSVGPLGIGEAEADAQDARLIGGCCGTTPAHIAAVAQALREFHPARTNARCMT